MPRVHHVKKSRKAQGACGKCGDLLPAGSAYRWWKFRYGGKRKRCTKPGCAPRGSDLTQSAHLSGMYAAQEEIEDAAGGSQDDIAAALNSAAEQAREVSDNYRESAENIESGFGHRTYQCDELEERADEVSAWADELEQAASEIESMTDVTGTETCPECGGDGEQQTDCESCEGDDVECSECGGEGEIATTCAECDGDGEVTDEDAEPDQDEMDEVASGASDQMP